LISIFMFIILVVFNQLPMKKLLLFQFVIMIFLAFACQDDNEIQKGLSLEKLSGYVQKGPYLNGTAITISELSSELEPTGKNFISQILDNKGTFEIKNVDLSSKYVELKADGFYFNEISNANSTAQLTLFALSDLTNKTSLNVNVLSTLEKSRVEYLISTGKSFGEAKKQAQTEILDIFEITKNDMTESEELDISKPGDGNAILLAISSILQGYLSVADLSELLANISTDIREDGVLNSQTLGSILINNARGLKLDQIRNNMIARYETLGMNITVSDFEKYVNQFINGTGFVFTNFIVYPESGEFGLNMLSRTKTDYIQGDFSLKAVLPEGTTLKVKISGQNWFFPISQENTGWKYSDWDATDNSRIFTATRTGEVDFRILLQAYQDSAWSNQTKIFVYENGATEATWQKVINVSKAVPSSSIQYPGAGNYGLNMLDKEKTIYAAGTYSMKAALSSGTTLKVKVSGKNWSLPELLENSGWIYSDLDVSDNSKVFTATRTGEIDYKVKLESYPDSLSNVTNISVFENGALLPTWQKQIRVTK